MGPNRRCCHATRCATPTDQGRSASRTKIQCDRSAFQFTGVSAGVLLHSGCCDGQAARSALRNLVARLFLYKTQHPRAFAADYQMYKRTTPMLYRGQAQRDEKRAWGGLLWITFLYDKLNRKLRRSYPTLALPLKGEGTNSFPFQGEGRDGVQSHALR